MSLIILGATLAVFESMIRQFAQVDSQAEVETRARQGADRLARQLRNLASPADIITNIAASTQPKSIDRDEPFDLIFKDVADIAPAGTLNAANVRRVRYCLQTPARCRAPLRLAVTAACCWLQSQTWTAGDRPTLPADTSCPGPGWTTRASSPITSSTPRTPGRCSGTTGDAASSAAPRRGTRAHRARQAVAPGRHRSGRARPARPSSRRR